MLCNLFSVFDPSCSSIVFVWLMKWFSMFFILFVLWQYWLCHISICLFFIIMVQFIKLFLFNIFKGNYKLFMLMSVTLISSLCMMGELGMIPFVFTSSSHLAYNMSLSIPLWLSGVLYLLIKSFDGFFSHLVPLGSPMLLVPFLVIIETISLLIRPFSLAVRLMANTMAGHMVMVLISGVGALFSLEFMICLPVLVGFMLFEFGVAMVQGYVFMSLVVMYWSESS